MDLVKICFIVLCIAAIVMGEQERRRKGRRRGKGRRNRLRASGNLTTLAPVTAEDGSIITPPPRNRNSGGRGNKRRRNGRRRNRRSTTTTSTPATTTELPTTVPMTTADDVTTQPDYDDVTSDYGGWFQYPDYDGNYTLEGMNERRDLNLPTFPPINPGFKARVTQHGMDYVSQVANSLMARELQKLKIPDLDEEIGPAQVKITDISVTEFPVPTTRLYPLPGLGLRLETTQIELTIEADYDAEMQIAFWSVTKDGSMKVTGSEIYFILDFLIGRDLEGKPTVEVVECEADGYIAISFEGGWSDALNLGSSLFQSKIKSLIMAQLCLQIQTEINTNTAWALQQFNVTEVIEEEYELDFHLVRYPAFTREAMEIFLKGSVYLLEEGARQEPPFEPPMIPDYQEEHTSRMLYVYITSYMLNSGLYAAYHGGRMGGNVTRDMLPPEAQEYMTTSCPDGICLGSVFPQIETEFPGADVAVSIYANQLPYVHFRNGEVHLFGSISADVFVMAEAQQKFLFKANINVSAEFQVNIVDRNVTFAISSFEPVAEMVSSELSDPNFNFFFDTMARLATQKFLKPKLTELGRDGFLLPDLQDVRFVNPEIIIDPELEDVLIMSTDIYYDGEV